MIITDAKIEEHKILTDLMRESKAYWGYGPEQMAKWEKYLIIDPDYILNNEVINLWIDDEILGFYSIEEKEDYWYLANLFIHPNHIRKGYGDFLMEDLMERAKTQKWNKIVLEADPNSELFYKKYGFTTVSKRKTSNPQGPLPTMEIVLFNE